MTHQLFTFKRAELLRWLCIIYRHWNSADRWSYCSSKIQIFSFFTVNTTANLHRGRTSPARNIIIVTTKWARWRLKSPACISIVYSTRYSSACERTHQSSASLDFGRGIHRWPSHRWLVNSPHKGPVTRKRFPLNDVIMHSQRPITGKRTFPCHDVNIRYHKCMQAWNVLGVIAYHRVPN